MLPGGSGELPSILAYLGGPGTLPFGPPAGSASASCWAAVSRDALSIGAGCYGGPPKDCLLGEIDELDFVLGLILLREP